MVPGEGPEHRGYTLTHDPQLPIIGALCIASLIPNAIPMASIIARKYKGGIRYRALIRKQGVTDCATFPTKARAQAWATKREAEILAGSRGSPHHESVSAAIDRFIEREAPKRRGSRWEIIRLNKFKLDRLASRPIAKVTSDDIARWRDERLTQVSPSSVAREMNLWAALFSVAVREWKWIQFSPILGVKRPPEPPSRRRGISHDEVSAIIGQLNGPAADQVRAAFLLSLETAMRAGEILGLTWDHVNLANRVVTLPRTKNGDLREVPLSSAAVDILRNFAPPKADKSKMVASVPSGHPPVFTITSATLDTLFRRSRDRAAVDLPSCATVRFHDARGEAITRLSRKLDILELMRCVGHRDINSLRAYYSKSVAEIALKLD